MNTIISQEDEKSTKDAKRFLKNFKLGTMLGQSNCKKSSGFTVSVVFEFIFMLIFTNKNLYRFLKDDENKTNLKKDTVYRFLNNSNVNWRKFLLLFSQKITIYFTRLTSETREKVLIIDDSFYDRNRSKKVELLSKVYDHSDGRNKKGFRMLTAGWSDGNSFVPLMFSLLTGASKKTIINDINEDNDKRTNGYKARIEAKKMATDVALNFIDEIKKHAIKVDYILFDSWFSSPKMITKILEKGYNSIAILKKSKCVLYEYNGKKLTLEQLYNSLKKRRGKAHILADVVVKIGSKVDGWDKPIKIVFARNNKKKNEWIAILSTNIKLENEEIVRIYTKRWAIEVFFKMVKSHLNLAKEFQGQSYDMLVAHTTIVFTRYLMISYTVRNNTDDRTFGDLFYYFCDELQDVKVQEAMDLLMTYFEDFLKDSFSLQNDVLATYLNKFISSLPSKIQGKLGFLMCES
ncbi:MAG: hypothetical protein RIQ33_1711 [Bacteroidota bacterium]